MQLSCKFYFGNGYSWGLVSRTHPSPYARKGLVKMYWTVWGLGNLICCSGRTMCNHTIILVVTKQANLGEYLRLHDGKVCCVCYSALRFNTKESSLHQFGTCFACHAQVWWAVMPSVNRPVAVECGREMLGPQCQIADLNSSFFDHSVDSFIGHADVSWLRVWVQFHTWYIVY